MFLGSLRRSNTTGSATWVCFLAFASSRQLAIVLLRLPRLWRSILFIEVRLCRIAGSLGDGQVRYDETYRREWCEKAGLGFSLGELGYKSEAPIRPALVA